MFFFKYLESVNIQLYSVPTSIIQSTKLTKLWHIVHGRGKKVKPEKMAVKLLQFLCTRAAWKYCVCVALKFGIHCVRYSTMTICCCKNI